MLHIVADTMSFITSLALCVQTTGALVADEVSGFGFGCATLTAYFHYGNCIKL